MSNLICYILMFIGLMTVLFSPIIYHWCIKENKSLQDGLRDWIEESRDDL